MKKKYLKPAVALALVAAMAMGGTLAYITDTTEKIDNKFVIANPGDDSEYLEIGLEETFELNGETVTEAKFLPGDKIEKAPVVSLDTLDTTVLTDGAYIFVELTGNVTDVLALGFAVDTNTWTAVPGAANVYYTTYDTTVTTPVTFNVFSTDEVTINAEYSADTFDAVQTLSVQAYAIQANNLADAKTAWAAVK